MRAASRNFNDSSKLPIVGDDVGDDNDDVCDDGGNDDVMKWQ